MENLSNQATEVFLSSESNQLWAEAYRRGDYNLVLADVEKVLSQEPGAAHEKLWWIICQFELEAMPVSALSTPVEELAGQLSLTPALAAQSAAVCLKLALRLRDRKQFRLGVIMLERALAFVEESEGSFPKELQQSLKRVYSEVLSSEIERAESKRESRSYVSSLEEKRSQLSFEEEREELIPKDRIFDSRSIVTATDTLSSDALNPESIVATPPRVRYSQLILPALTMAIGLVLVFFGLRMSLAPEEPPLEQAASNAAEEVSASPEEISQVSPSESQEKEPATSTPPSEDQAKHQKRVSKLDSALSRLENLSSKLVPEAAKDPEIDTEALKDSAKLLAKASSSKTPSLDPAKFENKQRQTIGTPVGPKKVLQAPDGRRYGPGPSGEVPLQSPDGKPVTPEEVRQFGSPVPYETIAGTEVFSAPSLRAVSLARLEKGAVVHVVSRMGLWLELRSTGGRKGYIYAQDASPVGGATTTR